ncbi:MAG TPA: ABC transporter ATP-binding protein [Rectinemataceae bacterium]|nr:ABC transporter ATP-binding protein [Rectinemataceae bacterium]
MTEHSAEFRADDEFPYDRRSPGRWILSHVLRYAWLPLTALVFDIANNIGYSGLQVLIGRGFDVLSRPVWLHRDLLVVALLIVGAALLQGLAGIGRNLSFEFLAQRVERDSRAELFAALLGKSQTWHSSQRVGDLMARATNDVHYLNLMFSPGVMLITDQVVMTIVPLVMVAFIDPRLLLVPLLFLVGLVVTVGAYSRGMGPLTDAQRAAFGEMNAGLADALEGIETVKANLGEEREARAFAEKAGRLRDLYVKIARVEGRYWPLLVFALAWAGAFLHAMLLWKSGAISIGQAIGYMLLWNAFRQTTTLSIFSFNLLQMGLSSASRILAMIGASTELDENRGGRSARIEGRVEFRNVSFSFGGKEGTPVLRDISFAVEAGKTVAIVGRTGSGKSSLARLVSRIFDASSGSVLVDGVDVRDWELGSLRSQIATVEQDVFLYSRSIRDNIGFAKEDADEAAIEAAAREAQAHDFISSFEKGYATEIGDRGVTLSGGQKQRIAIARAFLADPRILVLDDSTSAVDSKTEDEMQKAMRRAREGRTTFLITHRLSLIRWADEILLIEGGRLAASGSHEELLAGSEDYRRLFARGS